MGLDALRESTMARLDAVEGKHGESGKKGKAAGGQVMSSHSGHDRSGHSKLALPFLLDFCESSGFYQYICGAFIHHGGYLSLLLYWLLVR